MDLLVMRHTDMHRVHPKQDNSRTCAKCKQQVGIYPSGQAALRQNPAMRIICNVCKPDFVAVLAPGAELEPLESETKK